MIKMGTTALVVWGKYRGILGTYLRWSGESNLHIIQVPSFTQECQLIEIALRDGEFEVPA